MRSGRSPLSSLGGTLPAILLPAGASDNGPLRRSPAIRAGYGSSSSRSSARSRTFCPLRRSPSSAVLRPPRLIWLRDREHFATRPGECHRATGSPIAATRPMSILRRPALHDVLNREPFRRRRRRPFVASSGRSPATLVRLPTSRGSPDLHHLLLDLGHFELKRLTKSGSPRDRSAAVPSGFPPTASARADGITLWKCSGVSAPEGHDRLASGTFSHVTSLPRSIC